jgi:hypothetical protein
MSIKFLKNLTKFVLSSYFAFHSILCGVWQYEAVRIGAEELIIYNRIFQPH